MRTLLLIFFVCCTSIISWSQCVLKMTLLNSADSLPVKNARIYLTLKQASSKQSNEFIYTDENGYAECIPWRHTTTPHIVYVVWEDQLVAIDIPDDYCSRVTKVYKNFSFKVNEVVITGFKNEDTNEKISASIGYIDKRLLNSNDQTSLQNAFNSVAGVTMESRGYGGSHRLSIRGSSLRAPFAVRNIKIYANGIPLTSPDGQAPLEMLDATDIQSIEIIKGPAGSVWGSGNGGVVLYKLKQANPTESVQYGGSFQAGSYDLQRSTIFTEVGWKSGGLRISHVWQDNHGFRENESNGKNQLTISAAQSINDKHHLFFYGTYYDGRWQLPGGLTAQQVIDNPRQANIYSKNNQVHLSRERLMAGISHSAQYSPSLKSTTSFYSYTTDKVNPYGTSAFNNGYKDEGSTGYGGRTDWQYKRPIGDAWNTTVNAGGELQYEKYDITEHSLLQGHPNFFRYAYNIGYWSVMAFASADIAWKNRLIMNLGSSINHLNQDVKGNAQAFGATDTTATWKSDVLPRLGLNMRLISEIYLFAQMSKGNSNPTVFEMVDYENNNYNLDLRPEHGTNYEAGVKGRLSKIQMRFEVSLYQMLLTDAILSYTDSTSQEAERIRFANSGSTFQRGIEWSLSKSLFKPNRHFQIHLQTAGSAYFYRFDDYRSNETQLSGKSIPGVPLYNASTNLQLDWKKKLQLDIAHFWVDKTPLNSGNVSWSNPYQLVNLRLNYVVAIKKKLELSLYAGMNNVFNTHYSSFYGLNDINGRYFNPSPPTNYYGGIAVRLKN